VARSLGEKVEMKTPRQKVSAPAAPNRRSTGQAIRTRAIPEVEDKSEAQAMPADAGESSISEAFMAFLLTSDSKSGADEHDAIASINLIHRITALLGRSSTSIAEKAGIHVSDLYALLLLHRRPPDYRALSSEIQKALGFTSGGMTRRIDRLEEAGLVKRVPYANDRRAWMVQLKPKGLRLVEKSRSGSNSAKVNDLIRRFDANQWAQLHAMLKEIDETLSAP